MSKTMRKTMGSFAFRDAGDGCIIGKYIDRRLNTPLTESAKIQVARGKDKFVGSYYSTWLDLPDYAVNSVLSIKKNGDFYELLWSDGKKKRYFEGQGASADEVDHFGPD